MTSRLGNGCRAIVCLTLAAAAFGGCGGDDGDEEENGQARPVEGTFVGKVKGTDAFVAVVAAPAAKGERRRDVTVFACDAKRVCEWLQGTASGNKYTAASPDEDSKATGSLRRNAAQGSIQLPGGKSVTYSASPAAATSGLYTLTVSAGGKLTGASAAGVGLTGRSTIPRPGTGTLKLADGTRIRFKVSANASDPIRLPAGEVRAIVLGGRQLKGAGKARGEGGDFFIVSTRG